MAGSALRPASLRLRVIQTCFITCGLLGLALYVTLPMDGMGQAILTALGIIAFMLINRSRSRLASMVLVVLSMTITARYLFWRAADTIQFTHPMAGVLGLGLLAAEFYAGALLVLSYIQTAFPLDRKPVPLPPDPDTWPSIDIYVPSYNETLELVRPTVFAAMGLDWPRDKLNVWILDDGRRPEFRDFAEECGCGYIIRPDNKGAKAGNINHALRHTDGEYIAIFDCDHAPTRAFLQLTVGWLVRDKRIAVVQTPHHFYSPDPFERNLARKRPVPNEGLLFYGIIQQGNDMWNAAFFCGSCAVIRRTALEEIGGVPHETVTEDCHCALRMQKRGWHTAYIRLPLAAGLATERLGLHIGQRMRWARGMLQIMRTENTPFAKGIGWMQRACYFAAGFSYMFAIPRLVFLTAPTAFLFFGQNIIAASPLTILAYAGSHMFHTFATTSRLNGHNRHSFWSEIYEATLAVPLVPVTLLTLWDPRKGKFNVTDKGGTLEQGYLDLRIVWPNLVLLAIILTAFLVGVYGTLTAEGLAFQAYLLNTIWAGMCLVPTSAAVAVGREREQSRKTSRVDATLPAQIVLPDGNVIGAVTEDLSLSGARLKVERPIGLEEGAAVLARIDSCGETIEIPANLVGWDGNRAFLNFNITNIAEEAAAARLFFGRPNAWLHWDHWPEDKPLRSLLEVVLATADAVFRRYRFTVSRAAKPTASKMPEKRISDVVQPRRAGGPRHPQGGAPQGGAARAARAAGPMALLLAILLAAAPAFAQSAASADPTGTGGMAGFPISVPAAPAPASGGADATSGLLPGQLPPGLSDRLLGQAEPTAAPAPNTMPAIIAAPTMPVTAQAAAADPQAALGPLPPGARDVQLTLKQLGAAGPLQLHGVTDLQGVLFGFRGDEVVTAAKLTILGGSSPSLIPSLSQLAITLNEQPVGTVQMDPSRGTLGPMDFPIDPVFFTDVNRLNFHFSGRYTSDCNDPLSGLLWATVSDLSTLSLRIERLPVRRDLSRLPEPLFDRRVLRDALRLPVVVPAGTGPAGLRAAAVAASYFAVEADYRGASFPVSRALPAKGDAMVLAGGPAAMARLGLPAPDGPSLSLVANPADPFGTLLVLGGRDENDLVAAALSLAVARNGLSGTTARVQTPTITQRPPYSAPHWLPPDRPVRFGELVDAASLQSYGYSPGNISIPVRTAPDLYTWRDHGLPVTVRYRGPPGPIVDTSVSRLDASLSNNYIELFPLAERVAWPFSWVFRQIGLGPAEVQTASFGIPRYAFLGRDELQFRFDMHPLARGECVATPADIRAAIDPDSTIDISTGWRHATLPNLGYFGSAGFPYTRQADLAGTAAVLPDNPGPAETGAFLDVIGQFAAIVGAPATGLAVVSPANIGSAASRDLLVFGTFADQPALGRLLAGSALQVNNDRLSLDLPDMLQDARWVLLEAPSRADRVRASTAIAALGNDFGAIIAMQSPLQSGQSMVAIMGSTGEAVAGAVAALRDPARSPHIQGDLTLFQDGQISAYRTTVPYSVGNLPFWLQAQVWMGDHPGRSAVLALLSALLVGYPLYWMVRRQRARRLRARHP